MRTGSTLLPMCLKELGEASTLLVMDALIRQLGCSTGNFISATIVPAFHDIAAIVLHECAAQAVVANAGDMATLCVGVT